MTAEARAKSPKMGERVNAAQHEGVFEVVGVNELMQSANIRLIDGSAPVVPNVAWADLIAIEKP